MIVIANNENKEEIINYIGDEYNKSPYLYIDFKKYGFKNNNVTIYIQRQSNKSKIQCIVLCYHTGMHIFSKKLDFNVEELLELINEKKPSIICAEKKVIKALEKNLINYSSKIGSVRELKKINVVNPIGEVEKAKIGDLKEVARLLNEDEDLGKSYNNDELYNQLVERNIEGFSRNYVIRKDNKVVAHAATGGENEKVAIITGVITNPKYRGMGYASTVMSKLCADLLSEGKKVFLINYTDESTRLYNKIGFEQSIEFGKLVLKKIKKL